MAVTLVCLLLMAVFYPVTLTLLARFLTYSQPPERADAILVLGGEFWGSRPIKGAELGLRGYAPKVMISGALYQNRPESELSIQFLVEKGYPRELFVSLPVLAGSTVEEAAAVCPELRRRGAKKVLLVTSSYHSRRANVAFRLFCPGVQFRSVAAESEQFQVERWWMNPHFREVFFSEWKKLLGTVFWSYPAALLAGQQRP